jgi:hypothetical protein
LLGASSGGVEGRGNVAAGFLRREGKLGGRCRLLHPARGNAEATFPGATEADEGSSGDELGDDRLGELLGGGLGAAEGGFEGVAEGHELVDLGDDARLLGEGGNWDRCAA